MMLSFEVMAPLMFAGLILVLLIGYPVAFSLSAVGLGFGFLAIALGQDSRVNRHDTLDFHPLLGLGVVFSSRSHGEEREPHGADLFVENSNRPAEDVIE